MIGISTIYTNTKMRIKDIRKILVDQATRIVGAAGAKYYADESIETHIRKSPRSNHLNSTISDLVACLKHKTLR
jgi:hypothetical protein